MKLACGAKVLGLSKSSLQKVVLPLPKLEEQTKIATFLNLYYKKIELLNKKLNLLGKSQLKVHFTPRQKRSNMNNRLCYFISIEPDFFQGLMLKNATF